MLLSRLYRRSSLLILALLASIVARQSAAGQLADYYRGTVVNDDFTGQPASIELFIYSRTDSSTIGWMKVGKPLGGSGATAVVARDLDSLYLVTVTTAGDTLIWAAPQRTGTLEGRYWIKGQNYNGQGGRWRLAPQPRTSTAALVLFGLSVGSLCVLALAALSAAQHRRWWQWRANRVHPSADDRLKLRGVRGWLAWFVFGQSLLGIVLLTTVRQAVDLFGGTWMLAATVDGMRPVLFFEAAGHFFQLFGIVLGLVMVWRHSSLAPMYWVSMLILAALYAVADIAAGSGIGPAITAMFGPGAADFSRTLQESTSQNRQVITNAAIWSLYWIRSRRVSVVFGPAPAVPTVSAVQGSISGNMDAGQIPTIAR